MSGTHESGIKIALALKAKYGEDYYARIGKIGGSTPTIELKGFAANHHLASIAGRIGGMKSKRTKRSKI